MKITTIIESAKKCKTNVEKLQKTGVKDTSAYYYAKTLLGAKYSVKKIDIKAPSDPKGDYISRQINKSNYVDMAERLVKYVEDNHQMPNHVSYGKIRVEHKLYTYLFASAVTIAYITGKLPLEINVSTKLFTKKTETGNTVFDYFVKKTGFKPKMLDDVCDWVKNKVKYEFYFDDKKSNKQVIDSKAGNCTDLLQFLVNMAIALGYDYKIIHTKCRQSGTGHVYGMFRHKTNTNNRWVTRDVACIADESRYCIWCEVAAGKGYLLAENPSWFLQNLNK